MLQSRLATVSEELQKLKLQTQLDSKRIRELNAEKTSLTTRMRDQDEELKGKAKLLEARPCLSDGIFIVRECLRVYRMFMMRISP